MVVFIGSFTCYGSARTEGCFFGRGDSSGTGTVAGCDGGKESVEISVLAISKL